MTDAEPQRLGLLAKLALALALFLFVAGVFWHGVTISNFQRIWDNMVARPSGPKSFRFILQPSMAAIIGIYQGLKDAQRGRSPYFWTLLNNPQKRIGRLREGLNATTRIILLSQRGAYRRSTAGLHTLPGDPGAHHAHRRLMARPQLGTPTFVMTRPA